MSLPFLWERYREKRRWIFRKNHETVNTQQTPTKLKHDVAAAAATSASVVVASRTDQDQKHALAMAWPPLRLLWPPLKQLCWKGVGPYLASVRPLSIELGQALRRLPEGSLGLWRGILGTSARPSPPHKPPSSVKAI
ncbi:hypothetical protein RIF29_39938 [Crotalaria pallida]|uniref:Uncharacterized protein n=1 Tax=Crotalaria pallida TaxID=3830 RepID=A0AAN9E248_CROPI